MAEAQKISGEKLEQLIAQRCGGPLGERQLRNIAKLGYFPPPDRGQYDFLATVCGLLKYFRDADARKSDSLKTIEQRRALAKTEIAEVAAARAKNEVEEIAEVERSRIALVVMIRQKLLALPAKASSYLACCTDAKQMESELEKQIHAVLTDLEQPAFTARTDPVAQDGAPE